MLKLAFSVSNSNLRITNLLSDCILLLSSKLVWYSEYWLLENERIVSYAEEHLFEDIYYQISHLLSKTVSSNKYKISTKGENTLKKSRKSNIWCFLLTLKALALIALYAYNPIRKYQCYIEITALYGFSVCYMHILLGA